MQFLPLILVHLIVLAEPAAATPEATFDSAEILREVGQMEPADQQEWLRDLGDRLERAYRILLPAKDLAKKKESFQKVLHQKTISWDNLRELVEETHRRERAAVNQLTSQFRIQVYETFWREQPVFSQRQAALTRVLAAWEQAGKPFADQGKLLAWLENATRNSTRQTIGPMPPDPVFTPQATPANTSDSQTPPPNKTKEDEPPKKQGAQKAPKVSPKKDSKKEP